MEKTLALLVPVGLLLAAVPSARAEGGAFLQLSQLSGSAAAPAPAALGVAVDAVPAAPAGMEQRLRALLGPGFKGYLPPGEVRRLRAATGLTSDELLVALLPLAKDFSRPQVSGYPVGAVALGASGAIYLGGNLSFIGMPVSEGIHAEQAVVAAALGHGESAVLALAVTDAPCGYCRQFLYELGNRDSLRVLVPGLPAATVKALLPMAYTYAAGAAGPDLAGPWDNQLAVVGSPAAPADLVAAALAAANRSHSKYSCSGVALRLADGRIIAASYLEVSGGNPSVAPLQAALARLAAERAPYADIREAVLVEHEGAHVGQAGMAQELLSRLAPGTPLFALTAAR